MNRPFCAAICAINSKYIHSSLAPWYLKSAADEKCTGRIRVEVVEGTINESAGSILKRICAARPDAVGFSCCIWNISLVKRLIPMVRSAVSGCTIILGGPEVSYNPADYLKSGLADYVISGDGETPFALLLDALASESGTDGIPGLSFISGKNVIEGTPNIEYDTPASPYTREYLSRVGGRITYIETSRGCPFSCAFCLSGRCGSVRQFDVARAKRDIITLANSGSKTVKFVDRTFNADRRRAKELISFIIESSGKMFPGGVCFHFEIAGDILDLELISLLASAPPGIIQLEIGLQSFNNLTLERINRKTDLEQLTENIRLLVAAGNMHIHIDLIAGLPFEDMTSFISGFNRAYSLRPHMLQLGFLKLLRGAPMHEEPEKFPCVYSDSPPYTVKSTPWMSSGDIGRLKEIESAVDRLYNSGRFRKTLEFAMDSLNMEPFEFFDTISLGLRGTELCRISLNEYSKAVFSILNGLGADENALRDCLICDRLSTDSSALLPEFLRISSPKLREVKKLLESGEDTRKAPGVKRGISLLTGMNEAVYADYDSADPLTGAYRLKRIKF